MISFKKYLQKNRKKYNLSEDAILNDDDGGSVGDMVSSPSSSSTDLGIQAKGSISNNEILGKCDHMHGDGFFKDGCFHIPMGTPVYGRIPKKKKKNQNPYVPKNLDESRKSDISKEDEEFLKSLSKIFTTQTVDEFDNFMLGDVVRTPWKMEYKVVDKKDITDITKHPFYEQLLSVQKGEQNKYENGKLVLLTLRKI